MNSPSNIRKYLYQADIKLLLAHFYVQLPLLPECILNPIIFDYCYCQPFNSQNITL